MAEKEKQQKFSMTVIVSMVVFGLLLAGLISYFIATKIVTEKNVSASAHEPGVFVKLGDPKEGLIINIGGVNSGRYLKIGVTLEVRPDKKAKDAKTQSPDEVKILDTVVHTLRSQKVEDFDPAKQDQLKELIKNEVNKALGDDIVYQVYITNFILQ